MASLHNENNTKDGVGQLGRFMIARDVEDFVVREGGQVHGNILIETLAAIPTNTPKGIYDAYERIFFKETADILKYYQNSALFLKNLHLDAVITSLAAYIGEMTKILKKNQSNKKKLLLIHLPPIDMVLLAVILDEAGVKNAALNFNRAPVVNGISKTFEAHLLLASARENPRLMAALAPLVKMLPSDIAQYDCILDENDTAPDYDIATIDSYIAQAIGFKEHQVILRSEEYPDASFLTAQGIQELCILDIDERSGFDTFYGGTLIKEGIDVHREVIPYLGIRDIGDYEAYVLTKNKEYLANRVQQRELSIAGGGMNKYEPSSGGKVKNSTSSLPSDGKSDNQISKGQAGVAMGTLAMLMIFLFIIDMRNGAPLFADKSKYKTGSGASSSSPWSSGGRWTSGSSSSSSSYSSSSSSSSKSVSSFGGGGFSKGGG
ncbi:MAG: hypothetical protein U0518_03265 [Candidatus Gracilibacteria bacterium]